MTSTEQLTVTARMIGVRIRRLRGERGWTLRHLAERSGVDSSTISRLENGRRQTATASVVDRLAAALGCAPADLLGSADPVPPPSPGDGRDLLTSLIATSLDENGGHADAGTVAAAVRQVRRLRTRCRYREVLRAAAEAMPLAHAGFGSSSSAAVQLVMLCFDAAMAARATGDTAIAWIAAQRAQDAAERSGETYLVLGAAFARAHVALAYRANARVLHIVGAAEVSPRDAREAALTGMLRLVAAQSSARLPGGAERRDRELQAAHLLLPAAAGAPDPFALHFTEANIWLWRLGISLEEGDIPAAEQAARRIRSNRLPLTRRTSYYVDLARLAALAGDDLTARAWLARAEQQAPQYLAGNRGAQALLRRLA
ncbi:helix-turn-helix domain-containing protein [Hamadaea tsunoensis]|uniref:helix-turn-helix domain-containing protein n=1 Tax=Hamadaea tsunoensis TaxID=53368 RepID=UPI000408884A|nr:helix-turn-helix transcriptional regulator [Hamadaea tsunoensis]